MELVIVHLTDIHIRDEQDFDILSKVTYFVKTVFC